jgi:hypothetical protein
VGTTQIRNSVTNSAGATAQQVVSITVVDTTKPVLTPVGSITITNPPQNKQVTWPSTQVSESCRGLPRPIQGPTITAQRHNAAQQGMESISAAFACCPCCPFQHGQLEAQASHATPFSHSNPQCGVSDLDPLVGTVTYNPASGRVFPVNVNNTVGPPTGNGARLRLCSVGISNSCPSRRRVCAPQPLNCRPARLAPCFHRSLAGPRTGPATTARLPSWCSSATRVRVVVVALAVENAPGLHAVDRLRERLGGALPTCLLFARTP